MPAASRAQGALTFDEALTRYLGEFGAHQKRLLLLTSLLWVPNCVFILLMVFANKDPIKAHWWRCVNDTDAQCQAVYAQASPGTDFCSLDRSQYEWTDPHKSIISDFGLTCGKAIQAQVVNSAFFLGYLIGSGVFGSMADQHGRRRSLILAQGVATAATLMSGLSPNYWVYLVSRIITGVGSSGQALVTYLLATESIGPAWRGSAGVGTQMFFILGEFVLVLVAFLLQPWRWMCFCAVGLSLASMLLILTIPESPRWLLAKGRRAEAEAIIQRIADENGTRPPLEPLADGSAPAPDTLAETSINNGVNSEVDGANSASNGSRPPTGAAAAPHRPITLGAVLRDRHVCRRFSILAYVWCILCMTYYGISLALNGLQGSIYVTFMIAAAAEIPSNVLGAWLIERIGRHNSLAAGMLLGGAACLVCSFCPAGVSQALFAAVGKFGCAGAFTIASIYTSELFPTLVRSAVLGLENEAARVGGIAAPFIVLLGTQMNSSAMPFLVFGATSLLAGLLIFTLPETLGAPMPDTMKDMEAIQSIFTTKAWKQGWKVTRSQLFSTRAHGSQASLVRLAAIAEEGHADPSETAGCKAAATAKTASEAALSTDTGTTLDRSITPKQQLSSCSGSSLGALGHSDSSKLQASPAAGAAITTSISPGACRSSSPLPALLLQQHASPPLGLLPPPARAPQSPSIAAAGSQDTIPVAADTTASSPADGLAGLPEGGGGFGGEVLDSGRASEGSSDHEGHHHNEQRSLLGRSGGRS